MDQNINLREILRLHRLWLAGDPAGKRADLSGADLRDANLHNADLRTADLRRADLSGAILSRAILTGADLRKAILRWADLYGAILTGADLSGADLRDAVLNWADLRGVIGLPVVEDAAERLKSVAAAVLANPSGLRMSNWHSECGTAHCLAGWAIQQAGSLGQSLEQVNGPAITGRLLLGHEAVDWFYKSNEEVLEWLQTI